MGELFFRKLNALGELIVWPHRKVIDMQLGNRNWASGVMLDTVVASSNPPQSFERTHDLFRHRAKHHRHQSVRIGRQLTSSSGEWTLRTDLWKEIILAA